MADSLMGRVRADGKMVRGVEVRIRHPDMSQTRRSTTLSEPTDLETDVYGLMDALLGKVWDGRRPVRLVGLKLSQVYDSDPSEQPDLALPGFSRQSRRTLASLMDRLNERYGDGTVVRAHRL
jgi:DNA polymerase-4